jgi:outer membrane receptor for ferrienterochelin and colicin
MRATVLGKHTIPAAIAIAVAALVCSRARADDLDDARLADYSLEELLQVKVGVASHIPTTVLDAASSVEVIAEERWRRRDAHSIGDVLATVPGIAVMPALGGADAFAVRGYARSTSLVGVLVSYDGVPLNDLFRGAPTLNLPGLGLGVVDEIQLIEGPGSALHGADAFHGVVALRGFEADADTRELQANVRDNDSYATRARFSTALAPRVRASLALAADGQDDQHLGFTYSDPATGQQLFGERDNRYGARSMSAKLRGADDRGSWHAGVLLHDYDGVGYQGFGTRLAGTRDVGGVDSSLYLVNGGVRHDLDGGGALELSAYTWSVDSLLRAGRTVFDFESENEQRRSGVHGSYEGGPTAWSSGWAVVLGAEELAVEEARTRNYDLAGGLTLDRVNRAEGADRHILSATFEGRTEWADLRWQLVYGLRLDRYSDFGRRFSPRLGLIWHPHEHNAIKLLYGNAFRAPTANDINGTIGLIEANPALDAEDVDTLELVFMRQGEGWFAEMGVFHSDWDNGIVSVANMGGTDPFIFRNLEENRAHGVTAKLDWEADQWLLNFGASWVRSKNRTLDQRYDAFPRYIFDAEVGYRHARSATTFLLTQHWQIDARDGFPPSSGIPSLELPLYARTDAGAVHRMNAQWNLMLFVRNVLDRDNYFPSTAGTRGGIPDLPRTLSAEVQFDF